MSQQQTKLLFYYSNLWSVIGARKRARRHSANQTCGVRSRNASDDASGKYLSVFMVDHYVVWLHISVHDSHTVAVVQRLRERQGERTRLKHQASHAFSLINRYLIVCDYWITYFFN